MRLKICALTLALIGMNSTAGDLGSLSWLAGHWRDQTNGRVTEEIWLAPEGAMMLGMNRSLSSKAISFEWLRITYDGTDIALFASPQGRSPPVRFLATDFDVASVRFENPDHDFPTFIRYRRVDGDTLEACIGDQHKEQCWTWRKVEPSP